MKAVVQSALGEPADALRLIDIEDREPAPGEVLIDVNLAPVHHGDLAQTRAQLTIPEDVGYVRRGSEAVGIVRALGSDVEGQGKLKVGDRVIGFPAMGSWAESVAIPASAAIPVPADLSDEVAAQLLINYATARMVLRGLRKSVPDAVLRDGAVLVTGASTVVARLLLHFLDKEGLSPIGLARSTTSAKRVATELAGVQIAATEDADWRTQVTSFAAGQKIVGVLDCVSGSLLGELAPLLANEAAIVTYGALGGASSVLARMRSSVVSSSSAASYSYGGSPNSPRTSRPTTSNRRSSSPTSCRPSSRPAAFMASPTFKGRSRRSRRQTVTGSSSSSHSREHSELTDQRARTSVRIEPPFYLAEHRR